ncbi:uncharacterized protein C8Q71DRAFT_730917 [Rhodofomes roseus]|uniref:RRM domain-containing protein n=1 Tax=Rhodofomes roseus TaxID=34475 RepID=A0ABQ8L037_9APHY|nr:uncharacterized protein C8Q71DRAFT_730917 [Rhodofomes roseus]KAH9844012.1 hypothetical protein C8Q71DRAFT_730917 [Rhodofomes roseus]
MARFRVTSESSFTTAAVAQNRRLAEATLRREPALPRQGDRGKAKAQDKGKGKAKDKGKGRARTPPAMDMRDKAKLKMNVKRNAVLPRNLRKPDWRHLYVGNLNRGITQQMLTDLFQRSKCGTVTRVIIRTTAGVPASAYSNLPSSPIDRMYASVEFADIFAVRRALALNGAVLNGNRITVCLTAAELPEVKDLVQKHMKGKADPIAQYSVAKAVKALKRITVERTQAVIVPDPPRAPQAGPSRVPQAADPNARKSPRKPKVQPPQKEEPHILKNPRVMGVSFAPTIM